MSPALMQSLDPLSDELNTSSTCTASSLNGVFTEVAEQLLQAARATLTTAQQETQEAYSRYVSSFFLR